MTSAKKLVIVQPYVPTYRVPFFSRLVSALATCDIECVVAAGKPVGTQQDRADSASASWIVPIESRTLAIRGRTATLGGSRGEWKNADGVIVGLLGSSLDAHRALLESRGFRRPVGVWGHVKSYTEEPHPVDAVLETWQMRRADHVFAYTEGGREYAVDRGVPSHRVTAVMNTVDTESLARAVRTLPSSALDAFASKYRLQPGRVLAYIGGFDESKRIEFLAEALDHLWAIAPDVRVLIGGDGAQRRLFDRSIERGQVNWLGYVGDREKALIGQSARALLSPGRIGLVAVEALVLGIPLITTDWPFHAPEVEYLREGESRLTAPDSPKLYALYLLRYLALEPAQRDFGSFPTLDNMVSNFTHGVLSMMSERR